MVDVQKEVLIRKSRFKDVTQRDLDHFIGLCDMAVADDVIHQKEAELLLDFVRSHQEIIGKYPVSFIYDRLVEMLSDGVIDKDEERELFDLLMKVSSRDENLSFYIQRPCSLFYDNPQPDIIFKDKEFCLTGDFEHGPKDLIANTIESLEGFVVKNPRKKNTKYLVVGAISSSNWKHGNYGNKLEQVMKWKEEGADIKIVSEEHLLQEIVKQEISEEETNVN